MHIAQRFGYIVYGVVWFLLIKECTVDFECKSQILWISTLANQKSVNAHISFLL